MADESADARSAKEPRERDAERERTDDPVLVEKTWVYRTCWTGAWLYTKLYHRLRVEGFENVPKEGGAVLASNHQSHLDILTIAACNRRHVAFVARDTLANWKWLAFTMRGCGAVLVQRNSSDRKALRAMAQHLERGDLVVIFPEGTRSPDGRMYRGRTGGMRVALPLGVPIIPAAVTGAHGSGPRWTWGKGTSQRITVTYLPPLDTSPWVGREDDPQAWREATEALMARIREVTGQEYADRYPTAEELHARDDR